MSKIQKSEVLEIIHNPFTTFRKCDKRSQFAFILFLSKKAGNQSSGLLVCYSAWNSALFDTKYNLKKVNFSSTLF